MPCYNSAEDLVQIGCLVPKHEISAKGAGKAGLKNFENTIFQHVFRNNIIEYFRLGAIFFNYCFCN